MLRSPHWLRPQQIVAASSPTIERTGQYRFPFVSLLDDDASRAQRRTAK